MVRNERLAQYHRAIKSTAQPVLVDRGFELGGDSVFRRRRQHDGYSVVHIVDFQAGIKSLTGKFAVNLSVYSPEFRPSDRSDPGSTPRSTDCLFRQRLGFLLPPHKGLVDRLLLRAPRQYDRWWDQTENPATMQSTMREVVAAFATFGEEYFSAKSRREEIERELHERNLRRRALRSDDAG